MESLTMFTFGSLGLPKDDSLRVIMKELAALSPVPDIAKDDDREVQLTLTNRFETHVEEDVSPFPLPFSSLLAEYH